MSLQVIKFGFKNAFRKKSIAILSIIGIAIGIALMVVLSAATAGMDRIMTDTLAESVGDVEVSEYNKPVMLSQLPSNITDTIRTIESQDKIEIICPEIEVSGFQQYSTEVTLPASLQIRARGVYSDIDEQFGGSTSEIYEGVLFDNDYEVIVAEYLIEGNPTFVAIGQELSYKINTTYSINLTVTGFYATPLGPSRFLEPTFVMSIETARIINELYFGYSFDGYSCAKIRFDTEDIEETEAFAEELEALPVDLSINLLGDGSNTVGTVLDTFDTFALIISIIAIIAGGMSIIVAQLMGINERMKEFAIMKATGWKNRTIFLDILFESVLISIVGALVGFGFGTALMYGVQAISDRVFVELTWQIVLYVFVFGFAIGLVGGFIPGIRAARVKPMEVIRGI